MDKGSALKYIPYWHHWMFSVIWLKFNWDESQRPTWCSKFSSHLIGRRQRVTILGAFSRELPVTSGVPQGSILGPALFLIYVNSLPSAVRNSKVMMYEDDTKIYKEIKSRDDCASLQEDLGSLSAWSADSGLSFDETKCKVQTITRKRRPISASYQITGCIISLQRQSVIWACLYPVTWPGTTKSTSKLPVQRSSWDTTKGMLYSP